MERVVVIGPSCSGKTTLAKALAQRLDVGHIELDALNWKPGWQERSREEFRGLVAEAVAGERWVIDGNYSKARDLVWARATTLIWLNYPFPTVLQRALRRTCRRVFMREQLFSDNRETFRQAFLSRDSILLWVMKSYPLRRQQYRAVFEGHAYEWLEKIELRQPREADAFLQAFS